LQKDKLRIENAARMSLAKQKLKRKLKKSEQSKKEKLDRHQQGVDYAPGQT